METKFIARAERVFTQDGAHIATVWTQYPQEERREGESWLEMRDRMKPIGIKAAQETIDRARLMAAAPDLLEALMRCKFDSLNMSLADLAFCRAAITKATGEQ